jgi:exodeoxyribonuclease-3
MKFSLATWNVNSVRMRLDHIKRFVEAYQPDILCLQEIKCANESFPTRHFQKLGFNHIELNGQKAYHGVATLSRLPIERVETRDFNGTGEARHLAVQLSAPEANGTVVHNFYVPAGGDVPDEAVNPKFGQKLTFLRAMQQWCADQDNKSSNHAILVGDLNVAPLESDVWSHKQLLKVVSHTPVEVEHMETLRAAHDWVDVMREHIPPEEKLFTWWSYRARNWRDSNRGRRLDHIWVTPALKSSSVSLRVVDEARDWEKPSDHVPVLAGFDLGDL